MCILYFLKDLRKEKKGLKKGEREKEGKGRKEEKESGGRKKPKRIKEIKLKNYRQN